MRGDSVASFAFAAVSAPSARILPDSGSAVTACAFGKRPRFSGLAHQRGHSWPTIAASSPRRHLGGPLQGAPCAPLPPVSPSLRPPLIGRARRHAATRGRACLAPPGQTQARRRASLAPRCSRSPYVGGASLGSEPFQPTHFRYAQWSKPRKRCCQRWGKGRKGRRRWRRQGRNYDRGEPAVGVSHLRAPWEFWVEDALPWMRRHPQRQRTHLSAAR